MITLSLLALSVFHCVSSVPYPEFSKTSPKYGIEFEFPDFNSIYGSDNGDNPSLPDPYDVDSNGNGISDDREYLGENDHGDEDHNAVPTYAPPVKTTQPNSYNHHQQVRKCQTEMIFDFNNPKKPFQEKYNRIYAQPKGKLVPVDGAIRFEGLGHIEIPYFNQNDLRPAYFMSIVIKPFYFKEAQAIISNSLRREYATLSLSLHGNLVTLTVVERPFGKAGYYSKDAGKVIRLHVSIPQDKWSRINIEQDDKKIILTSENDHQKAYGRLPAITKEPLYIGAGASPIKQLAPFIGLVDEFIFDKCPVGSY